MDGQVGHRRAWSRTGWTRARRARRDHPAARRRPRRVPPGLAAYHDRRRAARGARRAARPLRAPPAAAARLLSPPSHRGPHVPRNQRRHGGARAGRLRHGDDGRHHPDLRGHADGHVADRSAADGGRPGTVPLADRPRQAVQPCGGPAVHRGPGATRRPLGQGAGEPGRHRGGARLHHGAGGDRALRPPQPGVPRPERAARPDASGIHADDGTHRRDRHPGGPVARRTGGGGGADHPRRARRLQRLSRPPRLADDRARVDAGESAPRRLGDGADRRDPGQRRRPRREPRRRPRDGRRRRAGTQTGAFGRPPAAAAPPRPPEAAGELECAT